MGSGRRDCGSSCKAKAEFGEERKSGGRADRRPRRESKSRHNMRRGAPGRARSFHHDRDDRLEPRLERDLPPLRIAQSDRLAMYALRPNQNYTLGKRRRDNVDFDIPEEPLAEPHTRSSTTPATTCHPVPIQIMRVLDPVIAPIWAPISVQTSTEIPSRTSVKSANTSPKPTHLPWDQLPEVTRTRLSAQYDRLVTRTWGSHSKLFGDSWAGYLQALGLSTCQKPMGIPEEDVFGQFPDLVIGMDAPQAKCNFYDLCHHR